MEMSTDNLDNTYINLPDQLIDEQNLNDLGYSLMRSSNDKSTNNYGHHLIKLCKSHSIYIVNGRLGNDYLIGKCTCKGVSVVDYLLANAELFTLIKNFNVGDLNNIISDVHCTLEFSVLCKKHAHDNSNRTEPSCKPDLNETIHVKQWNETTDKKYQLYLSDNHNTISLINSDLEKLLNSAQISAISVKESVNKVKSFLIAENSNVPLFKKITKTHQAKANTTSNKNTKPWYNNTCRTAKRNYNTAKRQYKTLKSPSNLEQVKRYSKLYKNEVKKQCRLYEKKYVAKLRSLKSSNPKDYWNLLNKSSEGKRSECKIAKEILYEHFSNLNNLGTNTPENNEIDIDEINKTLNNNAINNRIKSDEVQKAISNLRNNKAYGKDLICNEFMKSAKTHHYSSL